MQDTKQYISEDELLAILKYKLCNECFIYSMGMSNISNLHSLFNLINNLYIKFGFRIIFGLHDVTPTYEESLKRGTGTKAQFDGAKACFNEANIILCKIKNNYESGKYILDAITISEDSCSYLMRNLYIKTEAGNNCHNKIEKFLSQYIKDFQKGDLFIPNNNFATLAHHYQHYIEIIYKYVGKYGNKNITVQIDWVNQFRPIEYFLYLENKGFIRIKDLSVSHWKGDSGVVAKTIYFTMDVLKEYAEMKSIYENWLRFSNLSFRPDSGHAYNGEIAKCVFVKETPAYKAMLIFISNPEEKFDSEDLEKQIYGEVSDYKAKKSQKGSRIKDLVNKQLKKKLKTASVKSRVDIFSSGGKYWLSAVPNRK